MRRVPLAVTMVRFSVQFMLLWWSCIAMAMADEYVKYKDPKLPVGVRVEDLLRRMTLAEKIGQMVQVDRSVATDEAMRNYSIEKGMQNRRSSSHKTERKREAKFFGEILSSFDQAIRSTFICGPIELKFGRRVHNSRLYILDGGDQIWSILQLVFGP